MTLALDPAAWQAGFDAGAAGHSDECPYAAGVEALSWSSGWIEGEARRLVLSARKA